MLDLRFDSRIENWKGVGDGCDDFLGEQRSEVVEDVPQLFKRRWKMKYFEHPPVWGCREEMEKREGVKPKVLEGNTLPGLIKGSVCCRLVHV